MLQNIRETIGEISREIPALIEHVAPTIARMIAFALFVGVCAVPFVLLQHPERPSFWYSLAAYGVYLIGASQLLRS